MNLFRLLLCGYGTRHKAGLTACRRLLCSGSEHLDCFIGASIGRDIGFADEVAPSSMTGREPSNTIEARRGFNSHRPPP